MNILEMDAKHQLATIVEYRAGTIINETGKLLDMINDYDSSTRTSRHETLEICKCLFSELTTIGKILEDDMEMRNEL